jgi:hypothetical protein
MRLVDLDQRPLVITKGSGKRASGSQTFSELRVFFVRPQHDQCGVITE